MESHHQSRPGSYSNIIPPPRARYTRAQLEAHIQRIRIYCPAHLHDVIEASIQNLIDNFEQHHITDTQEDDAELDATPNHPGITHTPPTPRLSPTIIPYEPNRLSIPGPSLDETRPPPRPVDSVHGDQHRRKRVRVSIDEHFGIPEFVSPQVMCQRRMEFLQHIYRNLYTRPVQGRITEVNDEQEHNTVESEDAGEGEGKSEA